MLRRVPSRKAVLGIAIAGAVLVASASIAPLASAAATGRRGGNWERGRGGQVHNWDQARIRTPRGTFQNRNGSRNWNRGGNRNGYVWRGRQWNGSRVWPGSRWYGTRVVPGRRWYGARPYGGWGYGTWGGVIVAPWGYVYQPPVVVGPPAYDAVQPWWAGAPQITVFGQPYYYQASLGVYLGGIALNFDLSNGPPPGYLFYDPYCQTESDTLVGYITHAAEQGHPAAITLVPEDAGADGN